MWPSISSSSKAKTVCMGSGWNVTSATTALCAPSTTGTVGKLRMAGNQVFKHAVINISESIETALEKVNLTIADVDWFIPHQANERILHGVAKRLGLDEHKVIQTVGDHANTSAASIPLALSTAIDDGRIKRGDLLLMEAMGGGLTWGACLVRL